MAHGEARFSNITRPASLGFTHVPLTNITTDCILFDDHGKEHELERGGLLFKIKQVAYRLGRNKEEPEVSDNLSAAAALFELRAGEELDTANDPVKTNASNYY